MHKFKFKVRGLVVYYRVSFNQWEVYTICRSEEVAQKFLHL